MRVTFEVILGITVFILAIVMFLIGVMVRAEATTFVVPNGPVYEIYNMDTGKSETYAEQNLTINKEWVKIVGNNK